MRLIDKISTGVGVVQSVDEKYMVFGTSMSTISATSRTTMAVAQSGLNICYFSVGALWVFDALNKASKVAADLGNYA